MLAIPRIGPKKEKSFAANEHRRRQHAKNRQRRQSGHGDRAVLLRRRCSVVYWFAIHSNGHKITEKANVYVKRPVYCLPGEASERAQLSATLLTTM